MSVDEAWSIIKRETQMRNKLRRLSRKHFISDSVSHSSSESNSCSSNKPSRRVIAHDQLVYHRPSDHQCCLYMTRAQPTYRQVSFYCPSNSVYIALTPPVHQQVQPCFPAPIRTPASTPTSSHHLEKGFHTPPVFRQISVTPITSVTGGEI